MALCDQKGDKGYYNFCSLYLWFFFVQKVVKVERSLLYTQPNWKEKHPCIYGCVCVGVSKFNNKVENMKL